MDISFIVGLATNIRVFFFLLKHVSAPLPPPPQTRPCAMLEGISRGLQKCITCGEGQNLLIHGFRSRNVLNLFLNYCQKNTQRNMDENLIFRDEIEIFVSL